MNLFKLYTHVKFRPNEELPYSEGIIVGHTYMNVNGNPNPVYLITLLAGFYAPNGGYVSTLVVSCDCVEQV